MNYTKRGLIYATKSQRATGQSQRMQLYRVTLLHTRVIKLREKIAGVTSVLGLSRLKPFNAIIKSTYEQVLQ